MAEKGRILLVDDEADFLFSVSVALRKNGYRIAVAENGNEAMLKILDARKSMDPFHLLVTDIRMPGMTGLNLMDAVKLCNIPTPFFAMTCFCDEELLRELKRRGCGEVIEKPFSPEELVGRIEGILDPNRCEAS